MRLINKLKRFKYSSSIYNLFHLDHILHIKRAYENYGIIKRPWEPVEAREFLDTIGKIPRLDDIDSKDVLPYKEEFNQHNDQWKKSLLNWSENGYAILNQVFSGEEVDTINSEINRLLDEHKIHWKYERKLMFAFKKSEKINSILHKSPLISVLEMLLEKPLVLFSSINFKEGSEQKTHSDSIHMTTFPHGYMIAAWIALEDIKETAGPVHYYPGSHKLPYVMNHTFSDKHSQFFLTQDANARYEDYMEQQIAQLTTPKEVFLARKGDVFLWHANLLHGGNPKIHQDETRKSMVLHFFAPEAICFHEITCRPALMSEKNVQAALKRSEN